MATELAKPAPTLDTLEWLVAETVQSSKSLRDLCQTLQRHERGSEPYLATTAKIAVAAEVLRTKLNSLIARIDEIEDGQPDED